MSDRLTVSGGGRISVVTESMLASVGECLVIADRLASLAARAHQLGAQGAAMQTRARLDAEQSAAVQARMAARALDKAAQTMAQLSHRLAGSIEAYASAEVAISRAVAMLVSAGATGLGMMTTLTLANLALWPGVGPMLLVGAHRARPHDAASARVVRGRDEHVAQVPTIESDEWGSFLADEDVANVVRYLSDGVDDYLRGALGLPIEGRQQAATALFGIATATGALAESAVAVRSAGRGPIQAPHSLDALVSRIPNGATGAAQIRVERYIDESGTPAAVVYLGGTLGEDGQPWDMTSNVGAMGEIDVGSLRAAELAMREAGVREGDSVVFVGYSQGGLLASRLAESGDWSTAGILTVGSPGGAIAAPEGVPTIALAHDEDLVAAISGMGIGGDGETPAPEPVTVTRSLFDGKAAPEGSGALAGHDFAAYVETARLAQQSEDPTLSAEKAGLLAATARVSDGEVTAWRAERVSGADRRVDAG